MGAVPGWLLRHRVVIIPYLGVWGSYGSGHEVRCLVQEKLATTQLQSGVVRLTLFTVIAPKGTRCPEGSRVVLPDGRLGYVQAAANHDGGGLPTPDHCEIAVTVGSEYGPPLGGELIIILRRTKTGVDRYGNDRYVTAEIPVVGAAVRPLDSDEQGQKTTTAVEVVVPPGTPVGQVDRLRVRGLVYEIDGEPEMTSDPATGVAAGVRVVARRATG